jgi:hypothetical protein
MPQIKVIVQNTQSETGVTGTTYGDAIALDGALTVSAQVNVSNSQSLSGASAKLQVSNDPVDESPSVWTDYGSSQNITTDAALFFEKANPSGNWVRLAFAISSGSFDADSRTCRERTELMDHFN